MKWELVIYLILILSSCGKLDLEEKKKGSETNQREISSLFESAKLKVGDSIILYGGNNDILKIGIKGDTCQAIVKDIFFAKSKGEIAFIEFDDYESHNTAYSIDLYYINSRLGYKETKLRIWQKTLNQKEKNSLSEHWTCEVKDFVIEEGLKFNVIR